MFGYNYVIIYCSTGTIYIIKVHNHSFYLSTKLTRGYVTQDLVLMSRDHKANQISHGVFLPRWEI